MKNNSISKSLLTLLLIFLTINTYAIDLEIVNPTINPDPIAASIPYNISFVIDNLASATTPEDAQLIVVSITGFDPTNVVSVAGLNSWNCNYDIMTTTIDCDKFFINGEFPAGTTHNFDVQIQTGTSVVVPDSFNIDMVDDILGDETFPNVVIVNTTTGPAPVLVLVDQADPVPVTEGQEVNTIVDFQIGNTSVTAADKTLIDLTVNFDDLNFFFDEISTNPLLPTGWFCTGSATPVVCTFSGVGTLPNGGTIDFPLHFNINQSPTPAPAGNYAFTGFVHLSGMAEDSLVETLVINAPLAPNLIVDNSAPTPTPLDLELHHAVVTPPQLINYRLRNTGGDIINPGTGTTVEFSLALDDMNIQVNIPSPPAGWICSDLMSIYQCINMDAVYASGQFTDFTFEVAPLPTTPAGTYLLSALTSALAAPVANIFDTNLNVINPDIILDKTLESGIFNHPVVGDAAVNGDIVTYKVLVNNITNGSAPTNSITIQDVVPPQLSIINVIGLGNFGGVGACTTIGQTITCTNLTGILPPNVPGDDGFEIIATVNGTVGDVILNTAQIIAVDFDSTPNVLVSADTSFEIVPAQTDLSIIKSSETLAGVSAPSFEVGESFNYVLSVTNNGIDAAIGEVEISDILPLEVDFVPGDLNSPTGWNCTAVMQTGFLVSCVNTTIFSGANGTVDIVIPVTAGTNIGIVSNTAGVDVVFGSQIEDSTITNNSNTNNITITPAGLPVSISKSVFFSGGSKRSVNGVNPEFEIGDLVTYRIIVENSSNGEIVDLVVSDILDTNFLDASNVTFNILQSVAEFNCIFDNVNEISCTNLGILPFNQGSFFVLEIQIPTLEAGSNVSNIATASSSIDGFNIDSAPALINILGDPTTPPPLTQTSIAIEKNALVNGEIVTVINKGATFDYEIIVSNTGNGDLGSLSIIDNMPDGVMVNSVDGPIGLSCNNQGQTYNCNYQESFPIGTNITIVYNVTDISDASITQLTNTASAIASNAATQTVSNSIEFTSNDLTVNVSQSPNIVFPGSSFEMIIDVNNLSSDDLTGVTVTNVLPNGFSYSTQNKASTCQSTGQMLTCTITSLTAGSTESIVVAVNTDSTIAPSNSYQNTTTIMGGFPDFTHVSNLVITDPNQGGVLSYQIEINDDIDPVNQGSPFNYTATLMNNGTTPIQFIHVDFEIPSELTVNNFMTDAMDCSAVTTGLSCVNSVGANAGSSALIIQPGQQKDVVVINVQSDSYFGDVETTVIASSSDGNSETDTEMTTILENVVILNEADLAISLTNESTARQGFSTSFDIMVENKGPNSADIPEVTLNVAGLIENLVAADNSHWNCQINGSSIHCSFNEDHMLNGHMSTINVTANLAQVSINAENLILDASIDSSTLDPISGNNFVNASINVSGTPSEGEILSALQTALAGIANQQTLRAIENVASYCERSYFTAIEGMCVDLFQAAQSGEGETINNVMEQITPNEVIGQSTSVSEIARAQFRNIGSRLSQLRGGGGSGFSSAGLNASYGSGSIPLGMLSYLNKDADEVKDVNNDFISPWGFFVNGTISMGERDATGRELGFDFDSYGLTAGVDYRIDAKKVVGIAVGYANFDSEIEGKAEMGSTGITLTGYGSFYVNDNFYVDARISAGRPDFDQKRNINFTLGGNTIDRVAAGDTTANQYSFAMSAGYHFNKNSWNITPNASIRYVKTNIDGFTETGAGDFNFEYSEQDLESMVWSAGVRVSKAVSLKNGVITPQFDFDYNYESLNDGNDIEARFIMAPTDEIFILETDSPDRTYGSAGLGLVYVSSNGKQAYINYRSVLGLEGFSRGTINVGARFEF